MPKKKKVKIIKPLNKDTDTLVQPQQFNIPQGVDDDKKIKESDVFDKPKKKKDKKK
tara:strand:- start:198 stop:365 length:168 start_codon:yes stop_codon:yes gene_type:complete